MPERPSAESAIQIDDGRVRVTEWRFAPGAATGWHRHEFDYVVVPMTTGRLDMADENDVVHSADLITGASYSRSAGVEHNVINANDFEFVFMEIELKQ